MVPIFHSPLLAQKVEDYGNLETSKYNEQGVHLSCLSPSGLPGPWAGPLLACVHHFWDGALSFLPSSFE